MSACTKLKKKKWYFLISLVVALLTSKTHSSKPRQGIYKITAFGALERWLPIGTLHIFLFKPQRARLKYLLWLYDVLPGFKLFLMPTQIFSENQKLQKWVTNHAKRNQHAIGFCYAYYKNFSLLCPWIILLPPRI